MQTITVTELVTPPDALLIPCERPEVSQLETNADLVKFLSLALSKYDECAAKIEALRVFYGIDKPDDKVNDAQ